jgi:hypothetical protein
MNGDPSKPEIAQAQAYFSLQTRRAETQLPQMGSYVPRQLPPTDVRISEFKTSLEWLGIDSRNPRYAPFVRDCAANILMGHNRPFGL